MPFEEVYTNILTRVGRQTGIQIGLVAFGAATICHGQNAAELQRASVAKQLASVQKQRETARPVRSESLQPIQRTIPLPPSTECSPVAAPDLNRMIEGAAAAGQVEPDIVREVARQESAFYPCAVSAKGAEGLMQLMPATQAMLGVENPYDPEQSLWAGARLLKTLLTRYEGNVALALSAYNAGPARVDAADGIPAITETQNYVASILSRLSPTK
jgi:soluble lytic murein transglycosylase-like protein